MQIPEFVRKKYGRKKAIQHCNELLSFLRGKGVFSKERALEFSSEIVLLDVKYAFLPEEVAFSYEELDRCIKVALVSEFRNTMRNGERGTAHSQEIITLILKTESSVKKGELTWVEIWSDPSFPKDSNLGITCQEHLQILLAKAVAKEKAEKIAKK